MKNKKKEELTKKAVVILKQYHNWSYADLGLLFDRTRAGAQYIFCSNKSKFKVIHKMELDKVK